MRKLLHCLRTTNIGIYGFGASITNSENRSRTLARFDAMETLGLVLGTLLSPIVFQKADYVGCYLITAIGTALGLLYLKFFIKEPIEKKPKSKKSCHQLIKVSTALQILKKLPIFSNFEGIFI